MINDDLQKHLDGELPLEALDDAARGEAAAWGRMVSAFRVEAPSSGAPPWLEQRVMADIAALPEPHPVRRLIAWLTKARPVQISPMAVGLVVAMFAWVLLLPGEDPAARGPLSAPGAGVSAASTDGGREDATVIYVQFTLQAPGARSVSVAGDFSDWEADFPLQDTDGDGEWTGRVPVRPGVHAYMFLIDGTQWATDPRATRYQDDGFGNRNAVLAVAASQ